MSEQFAPQLEAASAPDGDLSAASVALIERYLQQQPKAERPAGSLLQIRAMVAYLMGEATPSEAHTIELCLVWDPAARGLFRRVDKALELLRRLAWDEVVPVAAGENQGGENVDVAAVARIWQERLNRQMKFKPVILTRYLNDFGGWSGARANEATRDEDQALAWSTMNAVLQQSLRPMARPAYAIVRDGGSPVSDPGSGIRIVGLPSRYQTAVVQAAEITGRGDLQVKVELRLAANHQSTVRHVKERIRLELTAGGRDWLLDEAEVIGESAEWVIPNIGAATGVEPGPLDLSRLTLKFGRAPRWRTTSDLPEPSQRPSIPETLLATIRDADGNPDRAGAEVALSMPIAPTFRGDRLCLTIGLPAAVRFARASYRLNIDLLVTPEHSQRLASFPVSRWAEDGAARVLEIPWPGASSSRANADLVLALLQISLQAGEGSSVENPET